MSRFFSSQVAWAYFNSSHTKSRSLRLIARGAMLGLALSLMILIVTLSVMNGFERDTRSKLLTKSPHIVAFSTHDLNIPSESSKILQIEKSYQVRLLLPQLQYQQIHATVTDRVSSRQISTGLLSDKKIPANLDFVGLKAPGTAFYQFSLDQFKSFSDPAPLILLPMSDLDQVKDLGSVKTQGFWLNDPFDVDQVSRALRTKYPFVKIISWKDQYQSFFDAFAGEKRLISLVLGFLIVLIYVQFALTLVLIFNDKKQDLIVLSICCNNKNMVYETFFFYGALNVIFGTIMGLVCGSIASFWLPSITSLLEKTFHFQFLPYQHYVSSSLPSQLFVSDIMYTGLFAIFLGLCTSHVLARYGQSSSQKYRLSIGEA